MVTETVALYEGFSPCDGYIDCVDWSFISVEVYCYLLKFIKTEDTLTVVQEILKWSILKDFFFDWAVPISS